MKLLEIGWNTLLEQEQTVSCPAGAGGILLLLAHAPMTIQLDGQSLRANSGDAVLIRDGTPFRYSPAEDDVIYDWVCFTLGNDAGFYQALALPENTLLRYADTAFLSTLLRQLCAEFYATNPRRSEMLECLMKAVLIRCAETAEPVSMKQESHDDPYYAQLIRLREKIYANPQEKWTVDALSSEMNMSRSYFQLLYREQFGLTCIADVINCKMNRARELLATTSHTIAHIAQLCGYDNEEHFMRQFKKNNGMTPTAYRKTEGHG